jgi:hypothetical protein
MAFMTGATHVLQWTVQRVASRKVEQIPKNRSQFGLKAAIRLMKPESLVIADQLRRGEYVPEPCTHRPSSHESREGPKSLTQPQEREVPKVRPVIGTKS